MFDNDQLMSLFVKIPIIINFGNYRPLEVIQMFRYVCARGQILHVFNASVDLMVSDVQGKDEIERERERERSSSTRQSL